VIVINVSISWNIGSRSPCVKRLFGGMHQLHFRVAGGRNSAVQESSILLTHKLHGAMAKNMVSFCLYRTFI
jgi:hypothetical protein